MSQNIKKNNNLYLHMQFIIKFKVEQKYTFFKQLFATTIGYAFYIKN